MKKRIDVILVENGHILSREKAKSIIMAGLVYVDEQKVDKAGTMVEETAKIQVRGDTLKYVSRGGLKLEKAIANFGMVLQNAICCDIGASTGGFTDCMLQNGASKVYAIDVGYGQLAWSLRTDERVVNMERTNIRYVTNEQVTDAIDFISIDVSFISLTLVLPVAYALLKPNGVLICLVKPQFEAGKGKVGKKGVVKEPEIHTEVIQKIVNFANTIHFCVAGVDFSPIKGPEGNIEYLLFLKKSEAPSCIGENEIIDIVKQSHTML